MSSTFSGDETAPFFGFLGAAAALVFSCMGAAYGTAKSGVGVASMGVMRPELVMKSIVPVVMAGVLGIYGLIIAVIISTGINPKAKSYYLFDGYAHLSSGLACGLAGLAAGMAIGIVGDAGVRANAQQPKLFVGLVEAVPIEFGFGLDNRSRWRSSRKMNGNEYDKELFVSCMRRFMYTRCYNSFEFLATLKIDSVSIHTLLQTLHYQFQKDKGKQGSAAYMLIIDSIGAFYWMDRALPSSSTGINNRKSLSLQTVTEAIVREIQRLLQMHPMLVLAAKSTTFGDKQSGNEVMRNFGKRIDEKLLDSRGPRSISHRDYMPSVLGATRSKSVLSMEEPYSSDDIDDVRKRWAECFVEVI
ncbi:hypothetical protein CASFOL_022906 [Castilleja foliolosa]|uniref:V-type proton ATPase proteolipid subunit n=1 Tax=Castilleja foliolosa TaxID=1961234 RepID=A0ABD3CWC4_9LAMI